MFKPAKFLLIPVRFATDEFRYIGYITKKERVQTIMSIKNEKYKNNLETEPERKKKFGKEFAEIPKGKHYVGELEPLIGAAVDLECDDWVFIPGELGGMPCEKLLLKSVKRVKCPASRGVENLAAAFS